MQEQGKESSTDSQNKKKENNLKEKKDLICCHDAGLGYENKAIIEHFNFEVQSGRLCLCGWRKRFREKYIIKDDFGVDQTGKW